MRTENISFDVSPRIVPANRCTSITIRPRFEHSFFRDGAEYMISHFPSEEFLKRRSGKIPFTIRVRPTNGVLTFAPFFDEEQEHVLWVEQLEGEEKKPVGDFRVYSLQDDLFHRLPFKGDFHLHSCRSDGREAPAYVAGASRRIGMDFMAVTDHRRYEPSLEAQQAFADVPIDLRIFAGEEVHPPDNPVHIINFAGTVNMSALFQDEKAYRSSVRKLQRTLPKVPSGINPYQYASCVWCFQKIRESGGLGIFCHPYWFTNHRYTPPGALTSYLFETSPFDAFEIIGGFHRFEADSNTLQVARYHEERLRGRPIPIVGASDSHGCERGELFGWYYTIVFSPTLDWCDLRQSVLDLYSVAVEALPNEIPRAYGPFRLVKYALFLMREVFPQHDELCQEEGRQMLEYLAGAKGAAEALYSLKGRTSAHMRRQFAQG